VRSDTVRRQFKFSFPPGYPRSPPLRLRLIFPLLYWISLSHVSSGLLHITGKADPATIRNLISHSDARPTLVFRVVLLKKPPLQLAGISCLQLEIMLPDTTVPTLNQLAWIPRSKSPLTSHYALFWLPLRVVPTPMLLLSSEQNGVLPRF